MKWIGWLLVCMFMAVPRGHGIVIRHDVDDSHYRTDWESFPPLATFYNIGVHGTLIHPEWVLTAAHTVFCLTPGYTIRIGDKLATVKARYSHPEYQLNDEHDIALIQLERAVTGIEPALLYSEADEENQVLWLIGIGGTGNGLRGQTISNKQNNGIYRLAQNRVAGANDSDIVFKFDRGDRAEPLEGVSGNGDSGGPAFRKENGDVFYVLGVSSRTGSWFKDIGEYGVRELYTRVSTHKEWIETVISSDQKQRLKISNQDRFIQPSMRGKNMAKLCAEISIIGDPLD